MASNTSIVFLGATGAVGSEVLKTMLNYYWGYFISLVEDKY